MVPTAAKRIEKLKALAQKTVAAASFAILPDTTFANIANKNSIITRYISLKTGINPEKLKATYSNKEKQLNIKSLEEDFKGGVFSKIMQKRKWELENDEKSNPVIERLSKHAGLAKLQYLKQEKAADKSINDAIIISYIAIKTGLTPNNIREIYANKEGKTDIKSLEKDFDGGKGVEKITAKKNNLDLGKELDESKPRKFVDLILAQRQAQTCPVR